MPVSRAVHSSPRPSVEPPAGPSVRDGRVRGRRGLGGARAAVLTAGLMLASLAPITPALADAGSRGEAIREALAQNGGRGKVLGVREERGGDGVVYAVKVITDGRVRVFRIRGR